MSGPILRFPEKNIGIIWSEQLVILIFQLVGMKLGVRQSEKQSLKEHRRSIKRWRDTSKTQWECLMYAMYCNFSTQDETIILIC